MLILNSSHHPDLPSGPNPRFVHLINRFLSLTEQLSGYGIGLLLSLMILKAAGPLAGPSCQAIGELLALAGRCAFLRTVEEYLFAADFSG